ncbi:N-6 DNA methylase [Aeromonas caviae]
MEIYIYMIKRMARSNNQYRDILGRYYTNNDISHLLSMQLEDRNNKSVLDLGSGDGSLFLAVLKRWPSIKVYSADIEDKPSIHPAQNHIKCDVLSADLFSLFDIEENSVDLVVCNPPFIPGFIGISNTYAKQYEYTGSCITSEIVFFEKSMSFLKFNGEAAFILPDGFFSSIKHKMFRKYLTDKFFIKKIIELPSGAFKATEAKTHILIIEKPNSKIINSISITMSKFENGTLSPEIEISNLEFISRGDYSFYGKVKNRDVINGVSIGTISNVIRGRYSSAEIKTKNIPYIHTTNINNIEWNDIQELDSNYHPSVAKAGDIVMSRVGRSFQKKIQYVKSGSYIISDCIFIIRSQKYSHDIYQYLTSEEGQNELCGHAYGVGAKQISITQLKSIVVPVTGE